MYFRKINSFFKVTNLSTNYIYNYNHNSYFLKSLIFRRAHFIQMAEKDLNRSLRILKQLKRMKNEKYSPANVYLQILGSGAPGAPHCLYVSADHTTYLFNCGEGTQRLAHEHHLKLSKLNHIFFTTPTWKNMGGLPGLSLTIQDSGVPDLNLHGPEGIFGIYDAVKRFVMLTDLNVTEASCQESDIFQDTCMSVRYVHLEKSNPQEDSDSDKLLDSDSYDDDDTDYYAHEFNKNGKRNSKLQNRNQPNYKVPKQNKKLLTRVTGCISYICKLTEISGKLDYEKCVNFGIKPGPLLGLLKSGQDVTLDNGTVVKSSDVCQTASSGPTFIVLECPDKDYLDSLVDNKVFKEYQNDVDKNNIPQYIVHFTPENVLRNSRYVDWMCKFSSDTQHIIINENNNCLNHEAIHRIQHKLHLLHPEIFPMLHDMDDSKLQIPFGEINEQLKDLKIYRAKTLNVFHLRPLDGFDNIEIKLNRAGDVKEVLNVDGFLDVLAELQTEINARSKYLNEMPKYPKIVMLGTGSCIPNKVRNTSGILLRIDEDTSILMDCGEDTFGQIARFFGKDCEKILKSIKAIYISHLHADHHLGLLGVIQKRKVVTDEPIFLLAPKQIESWIRLYHKKFERFEDTIIFVPNQGLLLNLERPSLEAIEELNKKLKVKCINTVGVLHCLHSFGISLTLENGKKIVYSGDTKPCLGLVTLGENCDLLIHEATMEDGLEWEATKKMHSTISQAISIGEQMNAKFTLLTHFSQRYSKMPRLPENSEKFNANNIGIAFDNMQFSLSQLSLLPLFYPALRLIFSEFCNLLELKAHRRKLKEDEKRAKEEMEAN